MGSYPLLKAVQSERLKSDATSLASSALYTGLQHPRKRKYVPVTLCVGPFDVKAFLTDYTGSSTANVIP